MIVIQCYTKYGKRLILYVLFSFVHQKLSQIAAYNCCLKQFFAIFVVCATMVSIANNNSCNYCIKSEFWCEAIFFVKYHLKTGFFLVEEDQKSQEIGEHPLNACKGFFLQSIGRGISSLFTVLAYYFLKLSIIISTE